MFETLHLKTNNLDDQNCVQRKNFVTKEFDSCLISRNKWIQRLACKLQAELPLLWEVPHHNTDNDHSFSGSWLHSMNVTKTTIL